MSDKKDFTPQEYESIIEELRKENKSLKKRIAELENKEATLLVEEQPIKEITTHLVETETSEPLILADEPMKEEEIIPIEPQKEMVISESIFSQNIAPLEMAKGKILQGESRRECPNCGNKNKVLIRETIDKTHLISDYPRMYGKKYHCGQCGVEWRVPTEI